MGPEDLQNRPSLDLDHTLMATDLKRGPAQGAHSAMHNRYAVDSWNRL